MAKISQFVVGTIVKLKSGGPEMTDQTEAREGYIYAQWFAGKKLEQGRFPVSSLEEVKPETKGA